jgi:hypothetical protein
LLLSWQFTVILDLRVLNKKVHLIEDLLYDDFVPVAAADRTEVNELRPGGFCSVTQFVDVSNQNVPALTSHSRIKETVMTPPDEFSDTNS